MAYNFKNRLLKSYDRFYWVCCKNENVFIFLHLVLKRLPYDRCVGCNKRNETINRKAALFFLFFIYLHIDEALVDVAFTMRLKEQQRADHVSRVTRATFYTSFSTVDL